MATDSITRAEALALLASQDIDEIIKPEFSESVALSTFRTVRMSAGTARVPLMSALPTAGWVTQDGSSTDVKPTSKVSWINKELIAEEMAVIVPVHENTLADSRFDIWGEIRPAVAAEFGRLLDEAIFFGTNKPATWQDPSLFDGILDAEHAVESSDSLDVKVNEAMGLVENDEHDVNFMVTGRFLRANLRSLRDENGNPIYLDSIRSDNDTSSLYGVDLSYMKNRAWDRNKASLIVGDSSRVVIGIREDVSVKLLDQATIGTGENQINLAERDMVALRFKFRVGYALATSDNPDEGRFPFAAVI